MKSSAGAPPAVRLTWLDATKGISILWIVYFHFFGAYSSERYPWPLSLSTFPSFMSTCGPSTFWDTVECFLEGCVAALIQRGPNAVGVFLILSGFGLTYSLAKSGGPKGGWLEWYRRRLLRLFPMYWVAHLVYLVSPFMHRSDPIDHRFLLSLFGDRVYPVETMFYYLVPSWWFFGLLLELYLVFPLLFRLLEKLRPVLFLILCIAVTVVSRYILFGLLQANGNYLQGAFFGGRLWEFATGMSLAMLYRERPSSMEVGMFSAPMLLLGITVYGLGLYAYQPNFLYVFSDGLIATGLSIILAHVTRWGDKHLPFFGILFSTVGIYSYGLYLLHQPYVIHFGHELHGFGMSAFLLFATIVIAIVAVGGLVIERQVNRLASRLLDRST